MGGFIKKSFLALNTYDINSMDNLPYSCGITAPMLCERILSRLSKGTWGVHFVDLLWPLCPASGDPGILELGRASVRHLARPIFLFIFF
jgi:hypothetical protein